MSSSAPIEQLDDIRRGLDALVRADPRLAMVIEIAGDVPLRLGTRGFEGLVEIIVSQQVSKASADAIHARLCRTISPLEPQRLLACCDDDFRAAGLSRPKQRAMLAISQSVSDGMLDLDGVARMPVEKAIAHMVAVKGIGPWTAEIYLLFCCGHPDIFPAGDLALQEAVRHAFGLDERPGDKALREIATIWSPWRGVAARLFWAYYANMRGKRDATPM